MNVLNTAVSKSSNIVKWGRRPNYLGIIFGLMALLISLLPSLLPRPWTIQGFVSGLSIALGYALGILVSFLYRWFLLKEVPKNAKVISWRVLLVAAPIMIAASLLLGRGWQNQVRSLLGLEGINLQYTLLATLLTILFFTLFFYIGRAVRWLAQSLNHLFAKKIPVRLSVVMAFTVSVIIVYMIVSGVLVTNFFKIADSSFSSRDSRTPDGAVQPTSASRSGSPESLISWDKLGFQGRGFVGQGPTVNKLAAFNKAPAKEPIRLYAGMVSAENEQERADLVVAELQRTKAFDRKILVIASATGTGWVDPTAADSLEYMYNGDSAIVSQQYSYLPSWMSFLVDKERARETSRVLYDTVIEAVDEIPKENRPKVVAYGLSLGSFGGQASFSGVNDIRRSVDGALFSGTPNDTELWRTITANRDEGSPEWQPVYKGERAASFASSRKDIVAVPPPEKRTRILYLQHANDPVVWFSFDLALHKPDWLKEPRGENVSPDTRWYPIVTFLQIGLDQAIAGSAPVGQGHYYTNTTPHAWAAVAPVDGWSVEKSDAVQAILDTKYGLSDDAQ